VQPRVVVAAAALALAFPAVAAAHATLLRSVPADGAVVASAPKEVRLVFDDVVQVGGGNEVVRNTGERVPLGPLRIGQGGHVLVLPLRRRLADGDYSVRWSALSDDGHFVSGVLAFAVGAGRAPPQSVLRAASANPTADDVVSRWLLFAGLLVACGVVAFWYAAATPELRDRSRRRYSALLLAGCVLFIVGGSNLAHQAGWGTRFGTAVDVGIVVALVGATCAAIATVDWRFRFPAAACSVAIAAVPSFAGHALDAGVPWLNVVADLLHVAAAAVWTGGLVALVVLRPPVESVRRISALALASVIALAATGVVRTVYELRAVHQLWSTGYGVSIVVKSALLLVLVGLGWLNRARLLESARLRQSVLVELALLTGVVVAVAFLTQLRPGRDAPVAAVATSSSPLAKPPSPPPGALVLAQEDRELGVAIAVEPKRVTVSILAPSGGGADGLDVRVNGEKTNVCGHGCYDVGITAGRAVRVDAGRGTVMFAIPRTAPPATRIVRDATHAFMHARSVDYTERLASSPTNVIVTSWKLQAPNRLRYAIGGDGQAIIVGAHRWDRSKSATRWQVSEISPLKVPDPVWGDVIHDARLLSSSARYVTVVWSNPAIPAWFNARFDRRTRLPVEVHMTAAAHFMVQRYLSFNRPLGIRPPTNP
jgi:copper transport protein